MPDEPEKSQLGVVALVIEVGVRDTTHGADGNGIPLGDK